MSDLIGFYKEFVDGEAGKDYLQRLVAQEAAIQIQAYNAKTVEEKALALERMRGLYDARTLLVDNATPPREQKSKPPLGSKSLRSAAGK